MFYKENEHTTEFCWEIGPGNPYTIIYPAELDVAVPPYVLQRVSDGFRTKILTCESRAEFPPDRPNMIHIEVIRGN